MKKSIWVWVQKSKKNPGHIVSVVKIMNCSFSSHRYVLLWFIRPFIDQETKNWIWSCHTYSQRAVDIWWVVVRVVWWREHEFASFQHVQIALNWMIFPMNEVGLGLPCSSLVRRSKLGSCIWGRIPRQRRAITRPGLKARLDSWSSEILEENVVCFASVNLVLS